MSDSTVKTNDTAARSTVAARKQQIWLRPDQVDLNVRCLRFMAAIADSERPKRGKRKAR